MTTPSQPILAILGLGMPEMLVLLAIVVLLFGAKKLPELAKGLGKSVKEFKKASADADAEEAALEDAPARPVVAKTETTKHTHGSN